MNRTSVELQHPLQPDESFQDLLNQSQGGQNNLEGTVIEGIVVAIENDRVVLDVGLKAEGRVNIREFAHAGKTKLNPGDAVEVYLERMEDKNGEPVLSREKACREEAWGQLEDSYAKGEKVEGVIFGKVKGGFTVDIKGAVAFLPSSQVDIRPVRDVTPLMDKPQPFIILKMDRKRGNIVVSRRSILEESRLEAKSELISNLEEGRVLQGVVKNITDYGAFIDLGGVDGLLHVTDISWKRVNHPSEVLHVGETIDVQVIKFNSETKRISLGIKQLADDPWQDIQAKYPVGRKLTGRVTNITDYGAFIELENGIEGLAHVSEMSWTKKNAHPGKLVSTSQEVEVVVLDVIPEKRRISLGLKQCMDNPWAKFAETHTVGSVLDGTVNNITEFGLFVGLPGEIDGMVHLSDLDWVKTGEAALADYKKGNPIQVKILDIDVEKERISLGVKQLSDDPLADTITKVKKGDVVTCVITAVTDAGIEVTVGTGLPGFIKKADLARDRSEQRPERFAAGEKVDAKIMTLDKGDRKCTLSIKAREVEEEKQAMAEYGSSDSGARLGDILGAAIKEAQKEPGSKADKKD